MRGVSRTTGKALDGIAHLRQSIEDIFTTRIGTRVMRRDYGSDIPNLVDRPANENLTVDFYVAIAEALDRWEPRLQLQQVEMTRPGDGIIELSLTGLYLPGGKLIEIDGIVVK